MDIAEEDEDVPVIELDGLDSEQLAEELDSSDESNEDENGAAASGSDDAYMVFTKHSDSVYCCAFNPNGQLAVTGGGDDTAFVWNAQNSETLFECKGHGDSVTVASFSHDGALVVTGDMGGLIKVWDVASGNEIWSYETTDLMWLKWHPCSHVLVGGTSGGDVWMWKVPSTEFKILPNHGSDTQCGDIMPDGMRAAVGYDDGSVKVWDLKTASLVHHAKGAETYPVMSLACHDDNDRLLTGHTGCLSTLVSSRSGKILATLKCDNNEADNCVESVGFSSTLPLAATGTLRGTLTIWDLPTKSQRHSFVQSTGIVKLIWSGLSLYTAGLDGVVKLWDARTGQEEARWVGHADNLLDMDITSDGATIITASDDKTSRIFHLMHLDR